MIPDIEEIVAGLIAGRFTATQACLWLHAHADLSGAKEQSDELLLAVLAAEASLSKISYALGMDGRTADGVTKTGAALRVDAVCTDLRVAAAKARP